MVWSFVIFLPRVRMESEVKQRSCQQLPLCINPQAPAGAAGESIVQHKIECQDIRQLIALDARDAKLLKMRLHPDRGEATAEYTVGGIIVSDYADIGVIALVAAASRREVSDVNGFSRRRHYSHSFAGRTSTCG